MKHLVFAFSCFFMISCADSGSQKEQPAAANQPPAGRSVTTEVEVFSNDTIKQSQAGGFGYLIRVDGQLYIFQPTIPAISGNRGFASLEDARRTGEFVAHKIRNNIMPPAVSVEELDSLGISR